MRALLKKDNVIRVGHFFRGYIIMVFGSIVFLFGRINGIYNAEQLGKFLMVYGFMGWIVLEILLGEKE